MDHINAFNIIKDKKKSYNFRKKKTSKYLSKKKREKNQSILPFCKERKTLFIINSDEDDIENKKFKVNSSSFIKFQQNQSTFLKNKDLNFKNKNLFRIYELENPENVFESIKRDEFNKEDSSNQNTKEDYQDLSNTLHNSKFHKDYLKNSTDDVSEENYSMEISNFLKTKSLGKNTKENNTTCTSQSDSLRNSKNDFELSLIIPKTKRRKFISSTSNSENDSQLEIENEINDLNKKDIIEERTRGSKRNIKRTIFQEQLQKLKKNKITKKTLENNSDDLEIIDPPQTFLSYHSSSSFSDNEIIQGDHESVTLDDFIVDDSEPIGQPYFEMPVEFTMFSYQGISSHFKVFIQHKIHKLLNPDFIEESDQFIFSLKDSVLSSSAWKLPFINALSSRPILKTGTCESRFFCDACNISGRISAFWVQFHGPKYDPRTLKIYENEEKLLEDEMNNFNEELWYLGRFCYLRAKIAHRFWHWHFNINEDLKRILKKSVPKR
ncbi:unnamed protein product [Pneumocystis jirovecii]|uniref:DUF4211 domain-containing protein n=1 Tax=Pneumocystis jirovecii TaxID=42068 RepID=L0P882_PNEJI|nr:unnamed protein product [Pneumocystis jirovecii]